MEYTFDLISAEEHDRLRARYAPYTEALEWKQFDRSRALRNGETGRRVVWANPVVGLRNAVAPRLTIHQDEDGRCWSEFNLGPAYEGPPGALRAEAFIERTDGIKTFERGHLIDAEGVTVEAEGVFIMPTWAREAG